MSRLWRAIRQSRRARILAIIGIATWISWRLFRAYAGAPYDALADSSWTEGTRVVARDGRLLGERPSPEGLRGRSMRLEDVSDRLILATIASEDRRWAAHDGVDRHVTGHGVDQAGPERATEAPAEGGVVDLAVDQHAGAADLEAVSGDDDGARLQQR